VKHLSLEEVTFTSNEAPFKPFNTPLNKLVKVHERVCPQCDFNNPAPIIICWRCGMCLDEWVIELSKSEDLGTSKRKNRKYRRMAKKLMHTSSP
jgi:hypothetical protein